MNIYYPIRPIFALKLSLYFLIGFYPGSIVLSAQDNEPIYQVIQLDSVTIQAEQNGFNVEDFIDLVIRDTTFYAAFHQLRSAGYTFVNHISILNRKGNETASYRSLAHQYYQEPCRYMTEERKEVRGDFFTKKGGYQYYTAKLYDRMFFTHDTVCKAGKSSWNAEDGNEKGMEKHVNELKKLIFTPGKKANVPLIGNKTAIFEKDMLPYYDYRIGSDTLNGQAAYVFTVQTKSDYATSNTGKTVIKNLKTWFAKGSFQILKRTYTLEANTLLYHFKVNMDIDILKVKDKYFPQSITYDGVWKVAAKKAEQAKFNIRFSQFNIQ